MADGQNDKRGFVDQRFDEKAFSVVDWRPDERGIELSGAQARDQQRSVAGERVEDHIRISLRILANDCWDERMEIDAPARTQDEPTRLAPAPAAHPRFRLLDLFENDARLLKQQLAGIRQLDTAGVAPKELGVQF